VAQSALELFGRRLVGLGAPEEEDEEEAEARKEPEAQGPAEGAKAEAGEAPEVSEYAKWALDQEGGAAAQAAAEPKKPAEAAGGERQWQRLHQKAEDEDDPELKKAREALKAAKSELRQRKDRQGSLKAKLEQLDRGLRWFALVDACLEKRVQQYNYKICYFGSATQDGTSLGTFSRFDPESPSALLFAKGQHCYGGPDRTLRLQLVCGSAAAIEDVSEPSRCSYEAVVAHPSACRREDLAALEAEVGSRALQPHEEL